MPSLGVDIGGTNARAALVDASGTLLASEREAWSDRSLESVVATVSRLVQQVAGDAVPKDAPVGVGFAGMVRGGVVVNAPNLGWRNVDLGSALEQSLGRKARLVNDLSAAAWGERTAGVAKGLDDTFTVFVGTGVGSALVVGGQLVLGATGVAGEFGHIKVVPEGGRPCGCGEHGCLEAYAGGAKLTEWMREVNLDGTPADLERLALSGHVEARRLYDIASGHLALAIANQVTIFNPSAVVLGGGVLSHCPGLRSRIAEVVGARASAASRQGLQLLDAALGDDSGLVGAALLA